MQNRNIIIHCAGGAGISIADKTYKYLADTDNEFKATLAYHCIDTSEANFKDTKYLKDESKLTKITDMNLSAGYLDGSGGVRGHSSNSIVKGVSGFLDSNNYLNPKQGEIHVILASGGGGSGNVIASMLLSNLMSKNIPVLLLLVGDSSNAKATENTRKSLLTINDIASRFERVVSIRYYLNNYNDFSTVREAQASNDASIAIMIDFLRIFNGDIKDLDYQDLINIINPKASDFNIPNGVYSLISKIGVSDTKNLEDGLIPIINRTIIQDHSTYKALEIMHSKVGYIENPELKKNVELIHDNNNLTLTLTAGGLQEELNKLQEIENRIKSSLEKARDAIRIDNNIKPDNNGLIF